MLLQNILQIFDVDRIEKKDLSINLPHFVVRRSWDDFQQKRLELGQSLWVRVDDAAAGGLMLRAFLREWSGGAASAFFDLAVFAGRSVRGNGRRRHFSLLALRFLARLV